MKGGSTSVLIVGGGVAGMAAAKVLDGFGINVHLVERGDHLGGKVFDWACMATDTCQYCGACLCAEMVSHINLLDHTTVYLDATLTGLEPIDTGYRAIIDGRNKTIIDAQAVLIATGLKVFDPSENDFYEYNYDGVITTAELNEILKHERLKDVFPKKESPAIAFIQCVGSRNRKLGLDYCSQVCCKVAVRQATKILHQIPGASITFFHIDLQNFGKIFRTQVNKMGERVKMVQGIPARILPFTDQDGLILIQEDPETGRRTAFDFDQIILAVGMKAEKDRVKIFENLELQTDEWGFLNGEKPLTGENVYAVGTATGPMDIVTAREQGKIAAYNIMAGLNILSTKPKKPALAIIGRGQEGCKTALVMAEEGYSVYLFNLDDLDIPDHKDIAIFRKSKLMGVSGVLGNFHITAKSNGKKHEAKVSAIIIASGSHKKPLSRSRFAAYKNHVISLSFFEQEYNNHGDRILKNIAFMLDHEGPEWKASARQVLNKAIEQREKGTNVTIIMDKMLVNGLDGQRKYDKARKMGIKFLRISSLVNITFEKDKSALNIKINEATLPTDVTLDISCDLLVVPEMIKPSPDNKKFAIKLCQELDEEGFLQSPNTRHRLTDSPRRGIFFVGSCHDETDDNDLILEINAIKASLECLELDQFRIDIPASIDEGKCARCLTCFRACPHGAIVLKEQFQPLIVENACFGCGLCVSSCPADAISKQSEKENRIQDHPIQKQWFLPVSVQLDWLKCQLLIA